jgi:FMN phosphatase YigB (HAD superfamily)
VKKQRLLYRTDHQALLEACRESIRRFNEGAFSTGAVRIMSEDLLAHAQPPVDREKYAKDLKQIPEIVLSLEPINIVFGKDRVTIVFMGGFDHAGVVAYANDKEALPRGDDMELIPGLRYYDDGLREAHGEAFQKGSIREDVFWQQVCGDLNRPLPRQVSLWGDAFRAVYRPRPEVFGLVRRLRERGCKTNLLSNTEAPAMQFFLELGYDMFDALTFSCAEGVFKPQREVYEVAAKGLYVAPAQCVLLDDRLDFVEGARNAGMKGIVYESLPQAERELLKLGVPL